MAITIVTNLGDGNMTIKLEPEKFVTQMCEHERKELLDELIEQMSWFGEVKISENEHTGALLGDEIHEELMQLGKKYTLEELRELNQAKS